MRRHLLRMKNLILTSPVGGVRAVTRESNGAFAIGGAGLVIERHPDRAASILERQAEDQVVRLLASRSATTGAGA